MFNRFIKIAGLLSIYVIFTAGCTSVIDHKTTVFEGENLITPYSGFLAGWHVSVENEENYYSRMWQHPILGFKDAYVVSVTMPEQKEIAYYRKIIDKPGYESCIEFTTLTVESSHNDYYPREIWQTSCNNINGNKSKILHLMLQGKDSFYHIQKIWQGSFDAQKIVNWQNRFKQIYLCDSRSTFALCPKL